MQPKTQYFTLYRGDTHLFKVSLTAENQPLDLSLSKFVMDIRAADGSIIQPTISIDGSDVWLLFPASLTADITWSRAEYDLRAVKGRLLALEASKEELSNHAKELASQRANLESVLTRLTEKDQTVASLSEQLQALRTEVTKAEESEEI